MVVTTARQRDIAILSTAVALAAACGGDTNTSSNHLFRLTGTSVDFDSRNDVESATVQVEGLTNGVLIGAEEVRANGELLTAEVTLRRTGDATAEVTIERRDPADLDPGDHNGRVRVRGCLGDDCEDAFVDIRYLVVKLLLSDESHTFFQRLGEADVAPLSVTLSHSDGSNSPWSAEVLEGMDPTDWLTVTLSGTSLADAAEISVQPESTPVSFAAWIDFSSAAGTARFAVQYHAVRGLTVSSEEITFTATAGETPAPQTIRLADAADSSYSWQSYFISTNRFNDQCPVYSWLPYLPRHGTSLPADIELSPVSIPEAHTCTGDLEILTDGVVNRVVQVRYVVSD